MLAQVTSVQATAGQLADLVAFCEAQAPGLREVPGFRGFWLLADRPGGKVVSIALWASEADRSEHEARGARIRQEAGTETGIASPPADLYEVVMQA